MFGLALLFAPALGPVLGGWFVDHGMWRMIFFVNVPIGVLGVLVARRFLVVQPGSSTARWDAWGLVTAISGFGASLYATSLVATLGWTAPWTLAWLAIGAVGLGSFAVVELRLARDPLLDLRLFRRPVFRIATLVGYVTVIAFFGAEFLLPVYLQVVRHEPARRVGLVMLPLALGAGLLLPIAGAVYDRIGPRTLVVGGFALLIYNTWQLANLSETTSLAFIVMLTAIRGIALGLTVTDAVHRCTGRCHSRGASAGDFTRLVVAVPRASLRHCRSGNASRGSNAAGRAPSRLLTHFRPGDRRARAGTPAPRMAGAVASRRPRSRARRSLMEIRHLPAGARDARER